MIRLALQTQKSGKRSLRSPLYQIEHGPLAMFQLKLIYTCDLSHHVEARGNFRNGSVRRISAARALVAFLSSVPEKSH
jgi:hypothetical protein